MLDFAQPFVHVTVRYPMRHTRSTAAPLARFGAALSLALAVLMVSAVALAGPPTDFVKGKSVKLLDIANQDPSPKRTKALRAEARALIDYEELAKRSLGKHWEARSADEKKTFITLLESIVELNYSDRFNRKAGEKTFSTKYLGEKTRKNQAIVKTTIKNGPEVFTVDYKLLARESAEGGFVIYDVVFDEVSLEETYRDSYVPIIEKEGWPSLIKRMRSKLAELKKKKR